MAAKKEADAAKKAAEASDGPGTIKPKAKAKRDPGLDDLLDAGLGSKKKGGK